MCRCCYWLCGSLTKLGGPIMTVYDYCIVPLDLHKLLWMLTGGTREMEWHRSCHCVCSQAGAPDANESVHEHVVAGLGGSHTLGSPASLTLINALQMVLFLANALTFLQGVFIFNEEAPLITSNTSWWPSSSSSPTPLLSSAFWMSLENCFRGPNAIADRARMAKHWASAFMHDGSMDLGNRGASQRGLNGAN